jgi:hypothetical protein
MLQGAFLTEDDEKAERYFSHQHDAPISLLSILESHDLDDALWSLHCVSNCDRDARLFAVWCARQVQHLMTDQRSLNALDIAEKFANGEATEEELTTAGDAARGAARVAARGAAGDAAWVATRVAARVAARDAQKEMFIAMCEGRAPWQQARQVQLQAEQASRSVAPAP